LQAIGSESLAVARVSALLCVPLPVAGTPGFIYLDSQNPLTRFTEDHLLQVTAIASVIAAALNTKRRLERLARRNEQLQSEALIDCNLIGDSPPMRNVLRLISRVAKSDVNVLLSAESGTGKELAARAIHRNSARYEGPFVAINCAMLSKQLLESTLFGHEKGSFTGAVARQLGKFEVANGGTIFLDEIGELAPELQAKLLRVVQEREFERIGSNQTLKTDVRLLAATNRNLKEAVENGTFRKDLYFRLHVVEIRLPRLRERSSDIRLLAEHFVQKYRDRCHRTELHLSAEALMALETYEWPGNVRELENAIERAVVFVNSDTIEVEDLPETIIDGWTKEDAEAVRYLQQLRAAKREIVRNALAQANGNYPEAALALGIHPNNLHRLTRTLGIKKETDIGG
jgi:Nif-specific regulatory protein